MRRRQFIAGLILTVSLKRVWAQQPARGYHIAIVHVASPVSILSETGGSPAWRALLQKLRRLGYVEGQNLTVERYSGEGRTERYAELARQVVRSKPELIVAVGIMVQHFQAATATIPIVGIMNDPVADGLAVSLARPGGNITGISVQAGLDISGKRLALLKEAAPTIVKVGFLAPQRAERSPDRLALQEAAQSMGISLRDLLMRGPIDATEYRRVFATISRGDVDALFVSHDGENLPNSHVIAQLAEEHRLPAIYPFYESAEAGGLLAYAWDAVELWLRLADAINQILKGANPGEIPIYQATKFQLIVNMKAAKAIGLTIPPALVLRADGVIE